MKLKKVLAVAMALCTVGMFTSCGGGFGGTTGEIEVNIANIGGGVGRKWLDEAIVRYNEERVADGKQEVSFDITHRQSIGTATMNTDDYNIYFIEGAMTKTTIASGMAMDITDVVTEKNRDGKTIDSKIDSGIKAMLTDNSGKYYALPHYEYYPGFSYNIDLFDANNLYFAQEQSGEAVSTDFGDAYFINETNTTKSLGNDGLPGTADDGLPTTLVELLQLCQHMDRDCSMTPFVVSGQYYFYANKMLLALWASLAGENRMQGCYDLECDDVNVVESFSDTPLFEGYDYAKTPVLSENRTVTQADGYKMHQQVERYYATLFMEIAKKSGWIGEGNSASSTTHTMAQKDFLFGGRSVAGEDQQKYGMLIEESYWYNETEDAGNIFDFNKMYPGEQVNIGWMSLPTSFDTPVTSLEEARNVVFLDTAASYTFINGNISGDQELTEVCKDFVQFLYTDEELSNFTKCTGVGRSLNYSLLNDPNGPPLEAQLPKFKQDIWDLRNSGAIIYFGSNNEVFQKNAGSFRLSTTCDVLRYGDYTGYYQATGVYNELSAVDYFNATGVPKTTYEGFLAN